MIRVRLGRGGHINYFVLISGGFFLKGRYFRVGVMSYDFI